MSTVVSGHGSALRPSPPSWFAPVAVGTATLGALWLSASSGLIPILGGLLVLAIAIYVLRNPDTATWIVAVILYTNAAVIAVRFHGVPFVVGAAFPLLLCLPIARDLLLRRQRVVIPPALPFVIAFFAIQILGALQSTAPERSMVAVETFAFEALLIYVLFTNAIRTPEVLRRVLWSLIAAGAALGAIVAYQQFSGNLDNHFGGFAQLDAEAPGFSTDASQGAAAPRQKRIGGPLGKPNRWAQIMGVLVPIAIFQVYASRRRLHKLLALLSCGLILLGGSLGFSRGGAVGLGLAFMLMTVMGYVRPKHILAAAIGGLFVALLVPQYAVRLAKIGNVVSLASASAGPGLDNADSATRGRLTEMIAAALVFADHPIIGVGPKMFREHYVEYARVAGGHVRANPRQAHNLALDIAAENGALGLLLFTAIIAITLRQLLQARRRARAAGHSELENLVMGLFFALIVYLTTSIFLHASYIRYAWFLIAVATAAGQVSMDTNATPRRVRLMIR